MKKIIFLLFLLCETLYAQRIQKFDAILSGTVVGVRFSISAGSSCNGYNVLHSIDSVNYYPIYNYAGICGELSKSQDHAFDHLSPTYDIVNFYKIELINLETSPARRVYVPSSAKVNMLLYPNPITTNYDALNLRVFNANNTRLVGFIYNQSGKPKHNLDITTKGEYASINVYDLSNDLYVLWLTDGYVVYSAKFIVNR
jgi:hypothetical protein